MTNLYSKPMRKIRKNIKNLSIADLTKDENVCGKSECGLCGVPNPMNTFTQGKANKGFAITFSPTWQKNVLENSSGKRKAKRKILCEHLRVKEVLDKKYDLNTSKYDKIKFKI